MQTAAKHGYGEDRFNQSGMWGVHYPGTQGVKDWFPTETEAKAAAAHFDKPGCLHDYEGAHAAAKAAKKGA